MTTSQPDYAAEFAHAQKLAGDAIEEIDTMTISETLPDELWSEEAVERIQRLMPYLIVDTPAAVELAYLRGGQPR